MIKANSDLIHAYKEKGNQEITQFIKQVTGDLDMFMIKSNKAT